MIKHIVMFKLKEKTPENVGQLEDALNGMAGRIDVLKFLEVGRDFKGSERSCDLVLISHFDSKEDLQTYADHEVHQPVLKLARSLCSDIHAVDYSI